MARVWVPVGVVAEGTHVSVGFKLTACWNINKVSRRRSTISSTRWLRRRQLVSLCLVDKVIRGPRWVEGVKGWNIDALAKCVCLLHTWSHLIRAGFCVALIVIVNLALTKNLVPELVVIGVAIIPRRGDGTIGRGSHSVWASRPPFIILPHIRRAVNSILDQVKQAELFVSTVREEITLDNAEWLADARMISSRRNWIEHLASSALVLAVGEAGRIVKEASARWLVPVLVPSRAGATVLIEPAAVSNLWVGRVIVCKSLVSLCPVDKVV